MTPSKNTLIRAAEIWVPDSEGTLLEFGAGLYGGALAFAAISRNMCFGRAEGVPGRVWGESRPILLTDLQSGHFRRAAAARQVGLVCAAAMPVYAEDRLNAVVVLFFGGLPGHRGDSVVDGAEAGTDAGSDSGTDAGSDSGTGATVGAVELWRNDPRISTDMTLADGCYGSTEPEFAAASRDTYLPRGSGLPGLAWQRQAAVFADGLLTAPGFLRADAAAAAGIQRGLALPCPVPGQANYALTLLSAATAPVALRVECWALAADGAGLQRRHGHCEVAGPLPIDASGTSVGGPGSSIALALGSGMPCIRQRASNEPGAVGAAAAAAGLGGLLVLPIRSDGVVSEAVALYF